MDQSTLDEQILEEFYKMIPPSKVDMFDRIAAERTRYLTVILENIYQEHNASAVMRSCESFGIQELHVIESGNEYKPQRDIARGAGRWIELYNYAEPPEPLLPCLDHLKNRGFAIAALTPEAGLSIHDIPLDRPVALLFGTEWKGISDAAREKADYLVNIPMYGFTESFNVSVSVALSLQVLRRRLEVERNGWTLTRAEQTGLKLDWCAEIMKNGEKVREELSRRLVIKSNL